MAMRTLKDNNRRKIVGVRLYLFFFSTNKRDFALNRGLFGAAGGDLDLNSRLF
jgi:hypothetical protein